MSKETVKILNTADSFIDAAIKSSNENFKNIQTGACHAIYVAAHMDIFDIDRLNKLINSIKTHDYELIRMFFRNVVETFAEKDSEGRKVSFLNYSTREKKFSKNERADVKEQCHAMRKAIQAAGVDGLLQVPFKAPDRDKIDNRFDAAGSVLSLVKRLAANGEAALAQKINAVAGDAMGDKKLSKKEIEDIEIANKPETKLAKLENDAKALREEIALKQKRLETVEEKKEEIAPAEKQAA